MLCISKFAIRNSQFEIRNLKSLRLEPWALRLLCYAKLAEPTTLRVLALVRFPKTGSITILDLLGVNVRGNALATYPTAEIFCRLIQDPGPVALHANVSHFPLSLGRRPISMKNS